MRTKPTPARRLLALLLAAVTLLGMMPALPVAAAETEVTRELREVRPGESWTMPYIEILVDWGIMRGDIEGNYDPEREISRAEYVTLLNRAFGYNDVSDNPFSDVHNDDWFYDDVCTAYNIGYLKGTSPTEASPHASLTREQGAVALGRNLMLEQTTGEVLNFVDSRDLGEWSRPLIRAVSDRGIISGYPDGTFQPFKRVTRGEVACMLVKAIGTPINQPGDYELGTVHGNLTVASSDVLLKNTTVTGDLYLTGGLGLGNVELRNVNVLGRIVASGAGESEKGDNSIVLTAVSADELLIDSIANQFVTLKADGSTEVDTTKVRTNAYIEDLTADGLGLAEIRVDGENGTALTLAGNVKNVTNYTPGSLIQVARGAAASVSVDEKATGANLQIDAGAVLKNANLDVSTTVSGAGDLAHVNINAADTTVTMLPDTVTIRPGLTASVGGREMDTMLAAESSDEPRLLAGFPKVQNIATSTAEAIFSSNKNGTIYWATSALADGSVDEADLINPPKNAGYILQSGSIKADVSKNEYMAKLSKLTNDGSYYLSAIAVDERGRRSPVKVTAFQTPDDTKPDFLTDYPAL
ncbi:MAG: S-layer homology domain-containing protein, partial [Clostridia bacterium]|nr:S-layer homology domain-containing protein [Clostridia bacterium]